MIKFESIFEIGRCFAMGRSRQVLVQVMLNQFLWRGFAQDGTTPNFLPGYNTHRDFCPKIYFIPLVLRLGGSSGASKEAKFFKELTFLCFLRYFSAKTEQSSKMTKTVPKNAHFGWFLKDYSILAEK